MSIEIEELKKTFAANLAARMAEKGWSVLRLSAECEALGVRVHATAIDRQLEGKNLPRLDSLRAMADALGCDMDDLLPSCRLAEVA